MLTLAGRHHFTKSFLLSASVWLDAGHARTACPVRLTLDHPLKSTVLTHLTAGKAALILRVTPLAANS
ncbi:hypothetical protein LNY53_29600 [Klebsiella pneumoniae]|nr:hypothetical protein [Klebsiella pneumoniae]